MVRLRVFPAIVVVVATACDPGPERPPNQVTATPASKTPITVDTIASGLDVPWAIAFSPDGRIFVTERAGRIRVIDQGVLRPEPWATLPVAATGEAGLMGLALAPDFESREVYVVGTFDQAGTLVNRVIRFTEDSGKGVRPTAILERIPSAQFHAGDALSFGPDGLLYVATGDAREPGTAQDARSLAGKILRLRRDGTVPDDNPIKGSLVFARGLRNTQGLTWDPETRQAFATEHGPSGFPNEYFRRDRDELNVIGRGANLGWPKVAGMSNDRRFTSPLVEWSSPGLAPAGIAFYSGPYAPWRNSVFIATLRGEQMRRVSLVRDTTSDGGWKAAGDESLLRLTYGRLRAVAMGPDGMIYFTTSNRDGRAMPRSGDDHLLRLRPPP